jgi:hypothetical protein
MGSYGDRWLTCSWCWAWGKNIAITGIPGLWDIDGVGLLCDDCIQLSEPPWKPNNRDRTARRLSLSMPVAMRSDEVLSAIAEFVADNVP